MKVICSWCRGEGRDGLVGEKAPLDDQRETHSICLEHERAVRIRWTAHRSISRSMLTTNGMRERPSRVRRVVLSAVQLYVGLKGFASKSRL
jgi:hypothetical protein